ncbi:Uracil phosphoribosyltransferase, partial [Globisporangium splendens]
MATPDVVASLEAKYPNLHVLKYKALTSLQIKLRDVKSSHAQFKHYADRLMRILAEEGLASCASATTTIYTPTGDSFTGLLPAERVCAVSIIRAGDSLLDAVIACDPSVSVGKLFVRFRKILIQRDETTVEKTPIMFYSKLPPGIESFENVLLVDPMLATGGSVLMAIKTLIAAGVEEKKITFLNVISCPEGIDTLFQAHPAVKIVTAGLDRGLNDQKYILPGLGDYGDRYYNTVE